MATNKMPFSHPADPSDVHGTSWILNQAGQGMQGKRTFAQHRFDARRAQPPVVQPLPHPAGPQIVPQRQEPFLEGMTAGLGRTYNQPSLTSKLIGAGLGAVVGVKLHDAVMKRRRAR
jgi:hypothetical protein